MIYLNIAILIVLSWCAARVIGYLLYLIVPSFYEDAFSDDPPSFGGFTLKAVICAAVTVSSFLFSLRIGDSFRWVFTRDILWSHTDRVISTLLITGALLFGTWAWRGRAHVNMSDAGSFMSWIPFILKMVSTVLVIAGILYPFHFERFLWSP